MDLTTAPRPAERLAAVVSASLAVLWVVNGGDASYARWIVLAHAAAAGLPWLFGHARSVPVQRWLRELFPLLFVVVVWSELGLIREVMHVSANDAAIGAIDRALFGRHIHSVWMPAMPQVWFSEIMFAIYFVYYPAVFLTPVVLLLSRRFRAARAVVFGLAVSYLGCYALYVFFPVDGPSNTMARYAGPLTEGFFYGLSATVVHAGDSLGTAFPSSHVVGSVTMAVLAMRWFSRPIATLFVLEAGGVVLSTVYTQNHFAVDAVAGLVFALVAQHLFAPALARVRYGGQRRAVVPPLPVYPALGETTTGGGT